MPKFCSAQELYDERMEFISDEERAATKKAFGFLFGAKVVDMFSDGVTDLGEVVLETEDGRIFYLDIEHGYEGEAWLSVEQIRR